MAGWTWRGSRLLTASGKGIVVTDSFTLAGGNSTLTAGITGIDATGVDLAGFKTITINGGSYTGRSLSVDKLDIKTKGSVTLTGDLNLSSATSVPGAVSVAGKITAADLSSTTSVSAGSLSVGNLNAPILTVGAGGITTYADWHDQDHRAHDQVILRRLPERHGRRRHGAARQRRRPGADHRQPHGRRDEQRPGQSHHRHLRRRRRRPDPQ